MFAIERVRIIKNSLLKDRKVSVAKLSELLNVTEVTIRRDLEKLEREGFLQRTHGGAVIEDFRKEKKIEEQPAETCSDQYARERLEIADTAFHLVSDNDIIMITDGLCNLQIAKKLTAKNDLTVLTNDLRIAMEFSHSPNNNVIVLGGDLVNYAVYGDLAINNMHNFSFNHLFVEVEAISIETGLMVSSIRKASLIHRALKASQTITVICLANNFGQTSFYRVDSIDIAHKIITNSTLGNTYKKYLFDLNIQLYTSIDIYEE